MILSEAERLAVHLLHSYRCLLPTYIICDHTGTHIPVTWKFKWHGRLQHLGTCKHPWSGSSWTGYIMLSKKWTLALPAAEVEDTIRHEIAHAIAGHEAGHGPAWQQAAKLVGAKPERVYNGEITRSVVAPHKWEMVDTSTGKIVKKYWRKPDAKVFSHIHRYWIQGRKEETLGKLILREVDLITLLEEFDL